MVFSNGVGVKAYYKPLGAPWPAKHTINIKDLFEQSQPSVVAPSCTAKPLPLGCACGHKWDCQSGLCDGYPPVCSTPHPIPPPTPPTPPPPTPPTPPSPTPSALSCNTEGEDYLTIYLKNPTVIKVKVKTCDAVSVNGSTAACQGNPLKPNYYLACGGPNDRVMGDTTRAIHFNKNVTYMVFSNGVGVKAYYKPLGAPWPAKHTINIKDLFEQSQPSDVVSIYKVDYPDAGACGEEINIEASNLNPHYFFPIHFGGFKIGNCADAGYSIFKKNQTVDMHPFPGVSHNLTFQVWDKP